MKIKLPAMHVGKIGKKPVDWRKAKPDFDPDDEELAKTPDDVLRQLGFDPKEIKQIKRKR